ncbi:unnamed protein product [Paramecium primaurelia]|uniref:Uncharacterized protein n=1 Tax=Paramecium primaurelia TaxID=5886 RepID=A0A8S1M6N8_PARPR|nr:unnamed protein product [Paramecium primaurelia]
MIKIKEQTRAGIKCFIFDRCLMQQDTERDNYRDKKPPINLHNCFICRTRQITTIEYPAKHVMDVAKDSKRKHVIYVKNKQESINYLDIIYLLLVIINSNVLIVIE